MNQKGGVGKTTCTVNLGAALASRGQRVLLIDMDPQANLGLHLDLDIHTLANSTYSVLTGRSSVRDAVIVDVQPNLCVLPANIDLSGAEVELMSAVGRETLLRDKLEAYLKEESFDYVLIDCPPSLGLLSLNALTAAGEVFIPLQTEFFALQGMTRLLEVVEVIRERLNPALEVTTIIATLYDARTNLSRDVVAEIREFFGSRVCETVIRTNVRLAEAPSHGQTIFDYAPSSHGSEDFATLADEIESRRGASSAKKGSRNRPSGAAK